MIRPGCTAQTSAWRPARNPAPALTLCPPVSQSVVSTYKGQDYSVRAPSAPSPKFDGRVPAVYGGPLFHDAFVEKLLGLTGDPLEQVCAQERLQVVCERDGFTTAVR